MKPMIFVVLAALAGCASSGISTSGDLGAVRPGVPRSAVLAALGEPGNRSFKGESEALQYCPKPVGMVGQVERYTTVWLRGGAVVGMTTESRPLNYFACKNYGDVDWGQAPPDVRVQIERR